MGRPIEDLLGGWIGGKGQRGKGVHDEIDPEELHGGEDGFHVLICHGRDEGEQNCSDVDGDLELIS